MPETGEMAIDDLEEFGIAAYRHAGMSDDDAAVVVDIQLEADRRGVDTHGFQRLPWYVDRLLAGENNPRPTMHVDDNETAVSFVLDGDAGLGQLVCSRAIDHAIAKAGASGLVLCLTRRSNDWGCGAVYPLRAARAGFLCFGTTTSVPTIAPFGSRTRLSGNNPMVFAVPRGHGPPIVLDMALTPVALGKVMRASAEGTAIPEEWGFQDREGQPTTDPDVALRGITPAIGGYKGTGLSLMMNVLAGVLAGNPQLADVANEGGKRGQCFLLVDPGLVGDRQVFFDDVETMAAQVHGAEPLPGNQVFLPGEIEQRRADAAAVRGTLSYPPSVVDALRSLGERIGVPFGNDRGGHPEGD